MATWHCRRCGADFAVGLPYCPQCTGTDVCETGSEDHIVGKISKAAGASNGVPAAESAQRSTVGERGPESVRFPHGSTVVPVHAPPAPAAGDDGPVRAPRPSTAAPKADWVAHAVTLGLVGDAAASLSKRDLVDLVTRIEAGELVVRGDGTAVTAPDPAD